MSAYKGPRLRPGVDLETWDWGPPKVRPPQWPDDLDVRRSMEWMRSLIPEAEWKRRRFEHVKKLHGVIDMPSADGLPQRFLAGEDWAGWYLLLAEAFVDHIADYEPAQGSRVIPLFKVLGRDFDLLMSIEGIEDRARRMLDNGRAQPDGALFEMLCALAYRRDGWPNVRFIPEEPGIRKTPDFEIWDARERWRVECKRLGRSEYSKAERDHFWRLWSGVRPLIETRGVSIFFDLRFRREIHDVPREYMHDLGMRIIKHGSAITVDDEWAEGRVSWTDLRPLQAVLKNDVVLHPSQRLFELLTGVYQPTAAYTGAFRFKAWENNGRYIDELDIATLARWRCIAPASINIKARHFLRQLVDANRQLEDWGPAIVHMGLEAMEGGDVEVVRRPKTLEMVRGFDAKPTDLRWLYLHYFFHESPPDMSWAMEETTDWFGIGPPGSKRPRKTAWVVVPADAESVPHPWQR